MRLNVDPPRPLMLFFPFDLLSHYLRCLMLAKYFSPYFEILFVYSETYTHFVNKQGFESFTCQSLDAKKIMEAVKKFNFSWINEKDLHEVLTAQVKIISQLKPLVVLGDTSPSLKMAAEKTGVYFISLMNGYMSKYYAFSRNLTRTHPAYPILKWLPKSVLDALTRKAEALTMGKVHYPFKKIRNNYKLPKKKSYLDELEGDFNLICDLAELFPQNGLPLNYKLIAPLYYEQPRQMTGLKEKLDKSKKTIFVSMGSTGDWQKVIFFNATYFSKYNLVTAGDSNNVLNASHIIKAAFINVHDFFSETDLVICHGGNGTIYQALLYGIPVLCKTCHFEQEWNVSALERLGVGKSIDDVENIDKYITVIEEWVQKKNNQSKYYSQRIQQENRRLHKTVAEIAIHILTLPLLNNKAEVRPGIL